MRRVLPLVSWVVGLAAATAVLAACGTGALAGPPLSEPAAWVEWASARDPLDAAVGLLRVAALGVCVYLLAATLLAVVVSALGLPRAIVGTDLLGGPFVRRLVGGALGATLAVAPATPVAADGPPPTVMMRLLDDAPTAPSTPTPPAVTVEAPPAPAPREWVVVPGDSFWRIAERHLEQQLTRRPTDGQVARYWVALIAANRDRLVVPSEPDLIHPGQRFVLP